jgi:hypothetical protein
MGGEAVNAPADPFAPTARGERLSGWACHRFDMPNHSGQGKAKQRRVECLWIKGARA